MGCAYLVKRSCLCEYPIKVINNCIDILAFKSAESNFKKYKFKIKIWKSSIF